MPNIQTLTRDDEYHQEITGSIMIPNKTWPIEFKIDEPENVIIKADSTDNMSAAGKSAEEILNSGISASEESSGQTLSQYDEYHQEITGSIMIPNKSWPIAFKFDEPENVIIKADSTDNMSAAGKSAEEILNSGISASEESSGISRRTAQII